MAAEMLMTLPAKYAWQSRGPTFISVRLYWDLSHDGNTQKQYFKYDEDSVMFGEAILTITRCTHGGSAILYHNSTLWTGVG